ncbi:hypothetical protein BAMA_20955 [Bacillus manliponensis]|uniref:Uncharacterized protein n=1 Tax=Bacillus manliponensis TaxID=574376 RepID=A0A073JZP1_9BACI|nr:hypothetical protein [Bacillus manliponensis]KEK19715.1 hypothetical protein BAMA_20955 [Bacillus manliponensis]
MNIKLTTAEKHFLNQVLTGLAQYEISEADRKVVEQQLLEHIEESREYEQDSMSQLGDPETFVKDFLEIHEIDLHSEIKHMRKPTHQTKTLIATGFFTSIVTYIMSQFLLSMFLTQSFSPLQTNQSFNYNVFYHISDNSWWNAMLMLISISISLLISLCVVLYMRKRDSVRSV